jgi:hypothetical protein
MFSNAFRGNDCRIYGWAFLLRCRNCSPDCASEVMLRPPVRLPGAWAWRGNCDRPARHARSRKGICPTGAMPEVVRSVLGGAGSKPPAGEVITAACEKFVADVLKPPFLPEIGPTKFNYPIAVYGKSATIPLSLPAIGPRTAFVRAGIQGPFAHREYVSRDTFDLSYRRYRGEWFCIFQRVCLAGALEVIEAKSHFQPC